MIRILIEARENVSRSFGSMANKIHEATRGIDGDLNKNTRSIDNHRSAWSKLFTTMRSGDGIFTKLRSSFKFMERGADDFGNAMEEAGNKTKGVLDISKEFGPILQDLAVKYAAPLISVLIALGAQLVAIGLSAGAAAAGIGVLLTTAIAQAIPAVGLLAAAMSRLHAVFKAVALAGKAQAASGQNAAAAAKQQQSAADTLRSAQESLAQAHQGVTDANVRQIDAQKALIEARKTAVRGIRDLILAEKDAKLAAEGAVLSEAEAQQRLQDLVTGGGTAIDIRRAQLDVQAARLNTQQTRNRVTDVSEQRRTAVSKGVAGSDVVVQAQRGLDQANRGVKTAAQQLTDAEHRLAEAHQGVADAAKGSASEQTALAEALAKLDPAERKLYETLLKMKQEFKGTFRSFTDPIILGVNDALGKLTGLLKNKDFVKALQDLSGAIGKGISDLAGAFAKPETAKIWTGIIKDAAANVPVLVDALKHFLDGMLKIAKAGGPFFKTFVKGIDDLLKRFDKWASNRKEVEKFLRLAESNLTSWLKLFGAIIGFFVALGGSGGAKQGQTAVDSLTKSFNGWAKWVRDHKPEMKKFWKEVGDGAHEVWRVVKVLAKAFLEVFDPEGIKPFADVLVRVVIPAFVIFVNSLAIWFRLFHELLAQPVVAEFLKYATALILVVLGLEKVAIGFKAIKEALKILGAAWKVSVAAIIIIGLYELEKRFHIFEKAIAFVKKAWATDLYGIQTNIRQFIAWLKGEWDKIKPPLLETLQFMKDHWKEITAVLIAPFKVAFDLIRGIWKDVVANFKAQFAVFGSLFKVLGDIIHGHWDRIASDLLNVITTAFKAMITGVVTALNLMRVGVLELFKILHIPHGFLEHRIPQPYFGVENRPLARALPFSGGRAIPSGADGGIVQPVPGGVYRVAEAGHPELIVPLDPGKRGRARQLMNYGAQVMGFLDGGVPMRVGGADPYQYLSFASHVDWMHVNSSLLNRMDSIGRTLSKLISVISGYRSNDYSAAVGGFAGDPHSQGIAVDAYIGGTPIGLYPKAYELIRAAGLRSGNDFVYHGKPDYEHVDLVGTSGGGGGGVGSFLHKVGGFLAKAANFVPGVSLAKDAISGIQKAKAILDFARDVKDAISASGSFLGENVIKAIAHKIADKLLGFGKAVIPGYGDGGIAWGPQLAMLGEKGPEAIVPIRSFAQGGVPLAPFLTDTTSSAHVASSGRARTIADAAYKKALTAFTLAIQKVVNRVKTLVDSLGGTFDKMDLKLRQAITKMQDGTAVQVITDGIEIAQRNMKLVLEKYDELVGAKGDINTQLDSLRAQLKKTTDPNKKQVLKGNIKLLTDLLDSNAVALQDNVEAQVQAQQAIAQAQNDAFKAIVDQINNLASYQDTILSTIESVADIFAPASAETQRARLLARLDRLRAQVKSLIAAPGFVLDPSLMGLLSTLGFAQGGRVGSRTGGIPILVAEGGYDEYVISTDPQYKKRSIGLISKLMQDMGLGHATGNVIVPTGKAYVDLADVFNEAPNLVPLPFTPTSTTTNNSAPYQPPATTVVVAANPSDQQLVDLNTTIAGLLAQIAAGITQLNTIQVDAFKDRVDKANADADRQTNLLSITQQIAEINGDQAGQLAALNGRQSVLVAQQQALINLLPQAVTQEQRDAVTLQIRQLDLAMLQNTKAIEDLTGQTKTQSFTTTAFQMFRQAIFTGSGGLLPAYQIPQMASGGSITKNGLFYLHAGERVVPTTENSAGVEHFNLYVTNPTEVADPAYLARRMLFEMRS